MNRKGGLSIGLLVGFIVIFVASGIFFSDFFEITGFGIYNLSDISSYSDSIVLEFNSSMEQIVYLDLGEYDYLQASFDVSGTILNPSIDVFDNSFVDWGYNGIFSSSETVDFVSDLNVYISNCGSYPCPVPIVVYSESAGTLVLDNFVIEYEIVNEINETLVNETIETENFTNKTVVNEIVVNITNTTQANEIIVNQTNETQVEETSEESINEIMLEEYVEKSENIVKQEEPAKSFIYSIEEPSIINPISINSYTEVVVESSELINHKYVLELGCSDVANSIVELIGDDVSYSISKEDGKITIMVLQNEDGVPDFDINIRSEERRVGKRV